MEDLRREALALLRTALGDSGAEFRDGQWEAIEALVLGRARLLMVQRTGWGKSIVYFLSTRLMRDRGGGFTLLVSPLLALMRDQIRAAERLGVRAATINSSNTNEWNSVAARLRRGDVDVLLISPERLANDEFREDVLMEVAEHIGFLVVDEAHCISDWGHDFRPDYLRDLSDEKFCCLTTIGRTMGRPHEIEMWFAVGSEADTLYMLSGGRGRSDWVRNLMKEPKVRVRIADETFEGHARIIEGEADDSLARELLVEKYEREPGKLARWRGRSLPVRVDFPL